jgi:hypothetical protein
VFASDVGLSLALLVRSRTIDTKTTVRVCLCAKRMKDSFLWSLLDSCRFERGGRYKSGGSSGRSRGRSPFDRQYRAHSRDRSRSISIDRLSRGSSADSQGSMQRPHDTPTPYSPASPHDSALSAGLSCLITCIRVLVSDYGLCVTCCNLAVSAGTFLLTRSL